MTVLPRLEHAARRLARLLRSRVPAPGRGEIRFVGQFADWVDAQRASSGYGAQEILERALRAAMAVKNGEAAYERDGVLFPTPEYTFPLLAALLLAASTQKRLSVLDFGGGLGSSYFQHRSALRQLGDLKWGIVEQDNFVAGGRQHIADASLGFYLTIEDCVREINPNFVLLSGVLSYLRDPIAMLRQLVSLDVPFICFDRSLVAIHGETRLTVQVVPPEIYEARYPCWILKEEDLLSPLQDRYRRLYEFPALGGEVRLDGLLGVFKGYLYQRVDNRSATGKIAQ